jgi:hypothetical protein
MYISIDIGGTNARVAASSTLENIFDFTKKEFKLIHNFDQDFSHLTDIIKELAQGKVDAIGMGLPGDLNREKTTFTSPSKNLAEWSDKPILKMLTDVFHCRVVLENDAVVAAIGEAHFGSEKRRDFTYITWGTGIGGAVVHWENDKSVVVKLDWYKYFQTWEQDCGGNAINIHLGKPAQLLTEEEWKEIMRNFYKHIIEFCKISTPALIIFGGGIAIEQAGKLYNTIHPQENELPEIKISSLGEDIGLYGAFGIFK